MEKYGCVFSVIKVTQFLGQKNEEEKKIIPTSKRGYSTRSDSWKFYLDCLKIYKICNNGGEYSIKISVNSPLETIEPSCYFSWGYNEKKNCIQLILWTRNNVVTKYWKVIEWVLSKWKWYTLLPQSN